MSQVTLSIPNISCPHCVKAITTALQPAAGIRTVNVNIPAKQATVEFDEAQINLDRIKAILAEEDYPVASTN